MTIGRRGSACTGARPAWSGGGDRHRSGGCNGARAWLGPLLLVSAMAMAQSGGVQHPFHVAQPAKVPEEVLLAVEIPAGSFTKYEIGQDGLVHVDRFLSMPMGYPANYGSMPRTLAGDGDPLDALVLTRAPLHPGTLIRFRPIGVLRMTDRGEQDEKVIGVPTDRVDPTYADVHEIYDLPAIERQRIEAFFRVYKALPEGRNGIGLEGFGGAAEARALIGASMARYSEQAVEPRR